MTGEGFEVLYPPMLGRALPTQPTADFNADFEFLITVCPVVEYHCAENLDKHFYEIRFDKITKWINMGLNKIKGKGNRDVLQPILW